jgi:anti-anti-sigma regulatory factor
MLSVYCTKRLYQLARMSSSIANGSTSVLNIDLGRRNSSKRRRVDEQNLSYIEGRIRGKRSYSVRRDLESFIANENVEQVIIDGNNVSKHESISDEGLAEFFEALQTNDTLRGCTLIDVPLTHNRVLESLRSVLCTNPNITTLRLDDTQLDAHGMEKVAQGLKNNESLTHLSLVGHCSSTSGFKPFTQSLTNDDYPQRLRTVHIECPQTGEVRYVQAFMNALAACLRLETVQFFPSCLSRCQTIYSAAMTCFLERFVSPDLETINCRNHGVNDSTLNTFVYALKNQPHKHFVTLDLANNNITDTGVGYIADAIRQNTFPIGYLNMNNNCITETGLSCITDAIHVCQAKTEAGYHSDGTLSLTCSLDNNQLAESHVTIHTHDRDVSKQSIISNPYRYK